MAQWLSWLERRPVTAKVESSSLFWVVSNSLTSLVNCIWIWNLSSAGRASALQAEGHRFEPYRSHMDGFPSGQRGQTVNLLAMPSKVRILLHPFDEYNSSVVASGYVPMWLNWQSSWFVISRLSVRVRSSAFGFKRIYRGMEQSGSSSGS